MSTTVKPRVAVHKFSSCDGCQLAFLNMGEDLLVLAKAVDLVHFVEAGIVDENAEADIAFVEGSISTSKDQERIERIRKQSRYLISLGACSTSGGIQALRNYANTPEWTAAVYARPEYIDSLDNAGPIASMVKVDLELWGCPVNSEQVVEAVRALLLGIAPRDEHDKVCLECKRKQTVCVMVSKGIACLGPVTRTGCGALCPAFGRDCYGCYGPAENNQPEAFAKCLSGLGLAPDAVSRRFRFIHSQNEAFNHTAGEWQKK